MKETLVVPSPKPKNMEQKFTEEELRAFNQKKFLSLCEGIFSITLPRKMGYIISLLENNKKTEKEINDFLKELISLRETDSCIIKIKQKYPIENGPYLNKKFLQDEVLIQFSIWGICNPNKHVLDILGITKSNILLEPIENRVFNQLKEEIQQIAIKVITKEANKQDNRSKYFNNLLKILQTNKEISRG